MAIEVDWYQAPCGSAGYRVIYETGEYDDYECYCGVSIPCDTHEVCKDCDAMIIYVGTEELCAKEIYRNTGEQV